MLKMNPDKIPHLYWDLANTYHTTNIGQVDPQTTWVTTHCIDVDTLSQAEGDRCGNWCGTTLNTDVIGNPLSALLFIMVKTKCKISLVN